MTKAKRFKEITLEMSELYERKNKDYGDSFAVSVQKYGNISALTRISDKFNRLESLILNKNQEVKDESLEDTLKDLASYCVMTLIEIEKKPSKIKEFVDNSIEKQSEIDKFVDNIHTESTKLTRETWEDIKNDKYRPLIQPLNIDESELMKQLIEGMESVND